jgi:hypothetical protein
LDGHNRYIMKYEIQTHKKYIVESADVASTLEAIKTNGEQLIRILEVEEKEE